ncbi:protein AAR2 homolog [Tubulanus polymorphus]|uniref:protein AAR2 homolog n=1 Tax=Tubulanus polymorphus TaxID=672921 RepID=UPI003DA4469C
MDNEMAKVLFEEGATFILLDVPPGLEFGIDYNSWTIGPKFKGVKMIPPGIHFIYYSARSKEVQTAPRTGFFYHFKHREILVRKWDERTEDIKDDDSISDEQIERFRLNKRDLDPFLGAYPYETYKIWVSLTNHLSVELLNRLQPKSQKISSVTEFESESSTTQSRAAEREKAAEAAAGTSSGNQASDNTRNLATDDACLPQMKLNPNHVINFTDCRVRYPESSTPSQLSKYNMDLTYTLRYLITQQYNGRHDDILGEIQFSFVCFLIGQVYDAFDQWKRLVRLLCTCEAALVEFPELYERFINALYFQVQKIPDDFFVDIVSRDNFLTTTLTTLFTNLEESDLEIDSGLRSKGRRFRQHLTRKFNWDFTAEPDEYSPVVVEIPQQ